MTRYATTILGILTLSIVYIVFRAVSDLPRRISPQGCRMSWMSPSYLLQSEFNASWTPLASRYSLLLYREVGWEPNQAMGVPVLFIPGNAGSSHQVRSIASSAARQYFSSPFVVSPEFTGRGAKPLDFYAVEFNEDLSAFHGPTLDSQISYTSAAVHYILSRYTPNTRIIVMGHSMGGVVGTALLPSDNISALITMSTPHTLPPARFDARIEKIYDRNRKALREAETPIVSVCGGATDMMIPSESCVLPEDPEPEAGDIYRRTVFTSSLEGAWTGVGHREMVWCHQVRWRIARAALELGITQDRTRAFDRWLRDGGLPLPSLDGGDSAQDVALEEGEYEVLPVATRLALKRPLGRRTYLLPIPSAGDEGGRRRTFVLYVSQGNVGPVGPHHASDLRVSVRHCTGRSTGVSCSVLAPNLLTLLPTPIPGKPFPVPGEGADESEGIVFFEAEVPDGAQGWVGVTVDADGEGRGWVAGGFDQERYVENELGLWDFLLGGAKVPLAPISGDGGGRKMVIHLVRLPATALLVYRLVPRLVEHQHPQCAAPFFSPLLVHNSLGSEIHYYRLASDQPVFLHTHSSAPYVPPLRPTPSSYGLNLTIHASEPSCQEVSELILSVDWWATVGRIGMRYLTTLLSWSIGIVCLLLFHFWGPEGQQLSVGELMGVLVKHRLVPLMVVAGTFAFLPLGPGYYLGVGDEIGVLRVLLAMTLVCMAAGMVCVSWWMLVAVVWPLRYLGRGFAVRMKPEDVGVRRSRAVSMALVLVLILLLVPWQVAFLGCWITQLFNCNAASRPKSYPGSAPTLASTPTDDSIRHETDSLAADHSSPASSRSSSIPKSTFKRTFATAWDQNAHMLLAMTWLLPLSVPVLVVWARTLQTAGYTTPFNGDHNLFKVAPVLFLVERLGRGRPLVTTCVCFPFALLYGVFTVYSALVRWGWVVVAVVAFAVGGRRAYVVYDAASIQMAMVTFCAWLYG